jgi:tryptophan-rich sensory protein
MTIKKIRQFVICLLIPLLVGLVSSLLTTPSIASWYLTLNKPEFTPPNWLFGPAWTVLFILMGIALFIIWTKGRNHKKFTTALGIFSLQLIFNFFWSLIFFSWHRPDLAFLEIIVLWLLIAINIYYFYKINKTAGWLLVPYLLWVSFAAVLNYAVFRLNF